MLSSNIQFTGEVNGLPLKSTVAISANGGLRHSHATNVAKDGQLTTRTDNSDGTLTMLAGHGITTSAVIDLYWDGGRRYNVAVGTVSGNSVPISGGAGDNLPSNLTNVRACVQAVVDSDFSGDLVKAIAVKAGGKRALVTFMASSSVAWAIELTADLPLALWYYGSGFTNPLAGDAVTDVRISVDDNSEAATIEIGANYDS